MATVTSSLSTIATDPLRNFKFIVTVHHNVGGRNVFANMGFMSVSGLNTSTQVIPYRDGAMNTTTQKLPGQTDFSAVTLTNGMVLGKPAGWLWYSELFSVISGAGNGSPTSDFRGTVTVDVLDHPVSVASTTNVPVKARFVLYNAWPTSLAYSDLDAGANAIIVTQMTLAHEGFVHDLSSSAGSSSL